MTKAGRRGERGYRGTRLSIEYIYMLVLAPQTAAAPWRVVLYCFVVLRLASSFLTNYCGKLFPGTHRLMGFLVYSTNIRGLHGGTAKHTGILLRMLHGVFRELSGTVSRFSRVLIIVFFWSSQSVFLESQRQNAGCQNQGKK